jgi:hypothetical protein
LPCRLGGLPPPREGVGPPETLPRGRMFRAAAASKGSDVRVAVCLCGSAPGPRVWTEGLVEGMTEC